MDRRAAPLLVCLLLGPGAARVASAQPRRPLSEAPIVGGQVAGYGPTSPTALIGDCDATLVAQDLLLTAAHCVADSTPARAWFGASIDSALLSASIAYCEAHPDYPWKEGTDIAYCRLAALVTEVVPARLTSSCAGDALRGTLLVLRAHGYTTAARREARVERQVQVQVEALQAETRELVVGDRAHGACNGDSGGSAYVGAGDSLELLGVISRRGPSVDGSAAEDCASTTIVTRVAPHIAWLAERTGAFSSSVCAAALGDAEDDPWLEADPEDEPFAAPTASDREGSEADWSRPGPTCARGCAAGDMALPAGKARARSWTVLLALALVRLRREPRAPRRS